jgi:hypothetical protein
MEKIDNKPKGDWRIAAIATLAKDIPAAYPGGPSHKAGAQIYQVESIINSDGENIGFITPSATAMALNQAIKASAQAKDLFDKLTFDNVATPKGPGKSISKDKISALYDFFEQCMVSATFSFQSIETFCNHTISRELKTNFRLKRRRKWYNFTPKELERKISTEEKLATVLPKIKSVSSPKGKKVWQEFKVLKETRDATIHLKSTDLETSENVKNDALFFQFLNHKSEEFPKAAVEMIRYFMKGKEPRWLQLIKIN